MEDSQRLAHYDAWASGKKWVTITVEEITESVWVAKTDSPYVFAKVERKSKKQAISAIHGQLAAKGIEISNLAEIQGIK